MRSTLFRRTSFAYFILATVCWASFVAAAPFASYDAGVAPAPGNAGAADPATQGWTFNNGAAGANQYAAGYDSGDGGWRTVDGTGSGPAFYQQNLSGATASTLSSRPWQLSATFSLDSDAIGSAGGFVGNYYEPRTDDNISLYFQTSTFSYVLELIADPTSPHDLFIRNSNVGASLVQVTTDGSAFDTFHDLALRSTDGGATADLYFDGDFVTTYSSVGTGANRVVFGADSSSGQGSAIWNQVTLAEVPEPASIAIWSLFGLMIVGFGYFRRRRRS